jgi:hypothetical protein
MGVLMAASAQGDELSGLHSTPPETLEIRAILTGPFAF